MSKERRLGRGLEALLGRPLDDSGQELTNGDRPSPNAPSTAAGPATLPIRPGETSAPGLLYISVYEIDPNPYQPRTSFDDATIRELADNIREHGILQPLLVRRAGDRYQLIAGERRLRAATVAGLDKVPAQVREANDRQMAELAIVENLQRKDLNPMEKAFSFQRYIDEYKCKADDLAARLSLDRSTIANLLRLLDLPEPVREAVRTGAITQGHGRALLPLGDEREQIDFMQRVIDQHWSVRHTEEQVQLALISLDSVPLNGLDRDEPEETSRGGNGRMSRRRSRSTHLEALEQELRASLGTKVDIRATQTGRGRIVIHFKSHKEFDRIREELASSGGAKSRAG